MTATQDDLFSVTEEAVQRAGQHADQDWMRAAVRCVKTLAQIGQPFSSDDLWELLAKTTTATTHEPRALGAVLRGAKRDGLIRATGEYVPSSRAACHQRPIPRYVGTSSATHPST